MSLCKTLQRCCWIKLLKHEMQSGERLSELGTEERPAKECGFWSLAVQVCIFSVV